MLSGIDQDTGARVELRCPIRAFDAPIDVDKILSYEWLARQNARVYPRKHGLLFDQECRSVLVAGEKVGVPIRRGDTRVCQVKQGRFRVEEPPTDDYGMRTEVLEECVRRLKLVPTRDCFATQETKKSDRYYSSEDDALSIEWDPNKVLWINPPWTL
jgi:hypothetical protein